MKIVKKASGETTVRMSRSEWEDIGRQNKWAQFQTVQPANSGALPDGSQVPTTGQSDVITLIDEMNRIALEIRDNADPQSQKILNALNQSLSILSGAIRR